MKNVRVFLILIILPLVSLLLLVSCLSLGNSNSDEDDTTAFIYWNAQGPNEWVISFESGHDGNPQQYWLPANTQAEVNSPTPPQSGWWIELGVTPSPTLVFSNPDKYQVPEEISITGAGIPSINGTYIRAGHYDGKYYWQKGL